jgi:hypothetical protein
MGEITELGVGTKASTQPSEASKPETVTQRSAGSSRHFGDRAPRSDRATVALPAAGWFARRGPLPRRILVVQRARPPIVVERIAQRPRRVSNNNEADGAVRRSTWTSPAKRIRQACWLRNPAALTAPETTASYKPNSVGTGDPATRIRHTTSTSTARGLMPRTPAKRGVFEG